MSDLPVLHIPEIESAGVEAFITTRDAGTFGLSGSDPVGAVMARWGALRRMLEPRAPRIASANQVHGARIVTHDAPWEGWLRVDAADGHVAVRHGTALAVSVADCVPVFIAHRSGIVSLLHAGWRGTAAGIIERAFASLRERHGLDPSDTAVHLGPAICGECYEVGPEVHEAVAGVVVEKPAPIDLRANLAARARAAGVRAVSISAHCTRCGDRRFFSHRAGDSGRQMAVIFAPL
jgi:YfiH family protein